MQKSGEYLELQQNIAVRGKAGPERFTYYAVKVKQLAYVQVFLAQLTVIEGQPSLYLQFDTPPTLTNFYFSPGISNHTVLLQPSHLSRTLVYLGVYSKVPASYTLYFSLDKSSVVQIFPDLPQSGVIHGDVRRSYVTRLSVDKGAAATFQVRAAESCTDLFVMPCSYWGCMFHRDVYEHPEYFNVYYSRCLTGNNDVTVPFDALACGSTSCGYMVAVINANSETPATFTLSVNYQKAPTHSILTTDSPVRMTLQGYFYYLYSSSNPQVHTITFQLALLAGSSQLYISRNAPWPSLSDYENTSSTAVIYTRKEDETTLSGTYYIAVYSELQATFELVVHESVSSQDDPIRLYPYQPQQGVVFENSLERDSKLYVMEAHFPSDQQLPFLISLTFLSGSFTLCLEHTVTQWTYDIDQYQWCFPQTSSSSLRISPTDPSYCANCTYVVLVKCRQFSIGHSASFTLTYSFETPIVLLQDAIPYVDEVVQGQYKHYSLSLTMDSDVNVSLTPLAGQPQVYISVSSSETRPDNNHFQLSSAYQFTLQWGDYCSYNCTCYVGIHSLTPASYSLQITQQTPLPLRVPTVRTASLQQYTYYRTLVNTTEGIAVSSEFLQGLAVLVVNLCDYACTLPALTDCHYQDKGDSLGVFVGVSPEAMQERCGSGKCTVAIGLLCLSSLCKHVTTALPDLIRPIPADSTVYGTAIPAAYAYYWFVNKAPASTLLVSLSCSHSDNIEVCASYGHSTRPISTSASWSASLSSGYADLLIHSIVLGDYIIGIRATQRTEISHCLRVSVNTPLVERLESSWPVSAEVYAGQVRYFSYHTHSDAKVLVSVLPIYGEVELQVNMVNPRTASAYEHLPQRDRARWSSSSTLQPPQLLLTPTDCSDCLLLFGLFPESNSDFSLSVSSQGDPVLLYNGSPQFGEVISGSWHYYHFSLDVQSDLTISLAVHSHSASLSVSTGEGHWEQLDISTVGGVVVRTADKGKYRIAVYSEKGCSYAITAYVKAQTIPLINGWSQVYRELESRSEFKYEVLEGKYDVIRCKLQSLTQSFWPDVSVYSPDTGYTQYTKKDYDRRENSLTFLLPGNHTFLTTTYDGDIQSRGEMGVFELGCTGKTNSTILLEETDVRVLSMAVPEQRFQIYVSEPGLLEVEAEPCTGQISLYVCRNSVNVSLSTMRDGKVRVEVPNAQGFYSVILSLDSEEASFRLSSSFYAGMRPKKIVAGNSGTVTWKSSSPDTVDLAWTAPVYEDGSAVTAEVSYQVYASSLQTTLNTMCGVQAGQERGSVQSVSSVPSPFLRLPNFPHYVTVIAFIAMEPIAYKPTEVKRETEEKSSVLWVIGAVLLAVALALLYQRRRGRGTATPSTREGVSTKQQEAFLEMPTLKE